MKRCVIPISPELFLQMFGLDEFKEHLQGCHFDFNYNTLELSFVGVGQEVFPGQPALKVNLVFGKDCPKFIEWLRNRPEVELAYNAKQYAFDVKDKPTLAEKMKERLGEFANNLGKENKQQDNDRAWSDYR